jgi:formylglycine-generating enzyme required for sulfatase activity
MWLVSCFCRDVTGWFGEGLAQPLPPLRCAARVPPPNLAPPARRAARGAPTPFATAHRRTQPNCPGPGSSRALDRTAPLSRLSHRAPRASDAGFAQWSGYPTGALANNAIRRRVRQLRSQIPWHPPIRPTAQDSSWVTTPPTQRTACLRSVSARRATKSLRAVAPATLLVATGMAMVCGPPRPVVAASHRSAEMRRSVSPQDRALTGGIAVLRAPASIMVRVAASTFYMGSSDRDVLEATLECQRDGAVAARPPTGRRAWPGCREEVFAVEQPRHRVRLSAYWLDRTEVTVAAYARCVALRRCQPPPYAQGATRFDKPTYPVSLVTWMQAAEYCHYRGARLPTEAEFERAARGVVGRKYPWGNLYNSRASNHGRAGWARSDARDGFSELAPVASFPAGRTPDGLLDLAGNVAEWVNDTFAPGYSAAAVVDPQGPRAGSRGLGVHAKVVRGGNYRSPAPLLRGAARIPAEPSARTPGIGFRCARSGGRP